MVGQESDLVELAFLFLFFFCFNDTATTEIYTLSLHDALPISAAGRVPAGRSPPPAGHSAARRPRLARDRKSTRLNSSHDQISYAVFCLKKKNNASLARNPIVTDSISATE